MIQLNPMLYDTQAIALAAKEYAKVCDINISKKKDMIIVRIVSKGKNSSTLEKEFCNYIIGLTKNESII